MSKEDKHEIKQKPIRRSRASEKILLKKNGDLPDDSVKGRVILSIGRTHHVEVMENEKPIIYECIASGTIISGNDKATVACVGDFVWIQISNTENDSGEMKTGKILKVEDRERKLFRKKVGVSEQEQVIASNVDTLLIFVSAADPFYNRNLIDRYIVAAELGILEPIICVNKMDLMPKDMIKDDFAVYEDLGINVFFTSCEEDTGLNEIRDFLEARDIIMSGPSGVGKSTFINYIIGDYAQEVQEISDRTTKGRHTTSYSRMFRINLKTTIIDTPGIREFGLHGIDKNELSLYYHDFDDYRKDCKYNLCSHIHEPNCAVKSAVENEEIDEQRYISYLNLFDSLED